MSFNIAPNLTYPYTSVVLVYGEQQDGSYFQASGVLVSPDEVLTAAHVVYDAKTLEVAPAATAATLPYGWDQASSWTYYPGFSETPGSDLLSVQQSQYDVGLIRLPDNLGEKTGWMGLQPNFGGGQVNITGYPADWNNNEVTEQVGVVTDPSGSVLDYPEGTVAPGASGSPLWVNGSTGPQIVGVVSTTGWGAKITSSVFNFVESDIAAHVISDANPGPFNSTVSYTDQTTGVNGTAQAPAYSGPVSYLDSEYIYVGSDDLNVSASTPNMFLHSGSGNDALQVSTGRNVLDGGTGSNFLVGGSGDDTFFVDGRGSGVTWSTVVNFHLGDAVTIWGYVPGVSKTYWSANDGTAGYQGSTLHAALTGGSVNASMTFAFDSAGVTSHFLMQTGSVGGNPYLQITYT